MRKTYENACREAGLSEEQIREIRRVFSGDCTRQKTRNRAMQESGYFFVSVSDPTAWEDREDGDEPSFEDYQIADEETDVEETAIRHLQLEELDGALARLPKGDREFLLELFAPGQTVRGMAEQSGRCLEAMLHNKSSCHSLQLEKTQHNNQDPARS